VTQVSDFGLTFAVVHAGWSRSGHAPDDADGIADHVGGAALTFRASWHSDLAIA
jgi:hypothetical protein